MTSTRHPARRRRRKFGWMPPRIRRTIVKNQSNLLRDFRNLTKTWITNSRSVTQANGPRTGTDHAHHNRVGALEPNTPGHTPMATPGPRSQPARHLQRLRRTKSSATTVLGGKHHAMWLTTGMPTSWPRRSQDQHGADMSTPPTLGRRKTWTVTAMPRDPYRNGHRRSGTRNFTAPNHHRQATSRGVAMCSGRPR